MVGLATKPGTKEQPRNALRKDLLHLEPELLPGDRLHEAHFPELS